MDAWSAVEAIARGQNVAGASFVLSTHVLGMTGVANWLVIESNGSVKERSMRMGQPPAETDLGRIPATALRAVAEALVAQKFKAIADAHKDAGPARRKTQISASLGQSEVAAELDTGVAETRDDVKAIEAAFTAAKAAANKTNPPIAPSPAAGKSGCMLFVAAAVGLLVWATS